MAFRYTDVRFASNSVRISAAEELTLSAISGRKQSQQTVSLFDQFVGGDEQLFRHSKAEHPGGLGVDDQLELARLHDRQVGGLRTFEDAPSVEADLRLRIRDVGSVR